MKKIICLLIFYLSIVSIHAQWTLNFNTLKKQIVAVFSSPNDSVCWFITNMDSLYKTSDAGATWTKHPPSNASFYPSGLFVVNELTAFKSGNGALYKTTNGGSSWSVVFSAGFPEPPVVWMKDDINGVMSYNGQLYKTTNGGNNWSSAAVIQPPVQTTNSTGKGTLWLHGDTIWVALRSSGVAYSPDFGSTWVQPGNSGLSFSGYGNISFSNVQHGIAVKQNSPYVYVTNDGAATWTMSINTLGANQDVLAYNEDLWFIPNPADHFYVNHSADFGLTWQQELFDPDGFEILEKSRNGNTLWAGTGKGKVYRDKLQVTTGVNGVDPEGYSFKMCPNPSPGCFSLFFENPGIRHIDLVVHDLTGRELCRFNSINNGFSFGEELAAGNYLATVMESGHILSVRKLFKIK